MYDFGDLPGDKRNVRGLYVGSKGAAGDAFNGEFLRCGPGDLLGKSLKLNSI